jgi:hypothetical protein
MPLLTLREKTAGEFKTGKPVGIMVKSTPKTREIYVGEMMRGLGKSGLYAMKRLGLTKKKGKKRRR